MQDWMRRPLLHDDFLGGVAKATLPPIHIIVKNGRVPLEAVVNREQEQGSTQLIGRQACQLLQTVDNPGLINSSDVRKVVETISSEYRPRHNWALLLHRLPFCWGTALRRLAAGPGCRMVDEACPFYRRGGA